MDQPSKWFGSSHRNYRHDPLTIALLFANGGKKAALHGLGHIAADMLISDIEKQAKKTIRLGVEKFLEELKKLNKR